MTVLEEDLGTRRCHVVMVGEVGAELGAVIKHARNVEDVAAVHLRTVLVGTVRTCEAPTETWL